MLNYRVIYLAQCLLLIRKLFTYQPIPIISKIAGPHMYLVTL
jgi:hypothetical protein